MIISNNHNLQVKLTKKKNAYEWSNFWADLGGNSGLWLGVSIVGLAQDFVDVIKFLNRKKNEFMKFLSKRKEGAADVENKVEDRNTTAELTRL